MPKKRTPKTVKPEPSEDQIEAFADLADQPAQKKTRLDRHAKPTIGINVKFNEYEHQLLKRIARIEGRSLQKQIKHSLIKALEEYDKK